MKVMAHNRGGYPVYLNVKQSYTNPNRLFISTPNMVELDPDQVDDLIDVLEVVSRRIWR